MDPLIRAPRKDEATGWRYHYLDGRPYKGPTEIPEWVREYARTGPYRGGPPDVPPPEPRPEPELRWTTIAICAVLVFGILAIAAVLWGQVGD